MRSLRLNCSFQSDRTSALAKRARQNRREKLARITKSPNAAVPWIRLPSRSAHLFFNTLCSRLRSNPTGALSVNKFLPQAKFNPGSMEIV